MAERNHCANRYKRIVLFGETFIASVQIEEANSFGSLRVDAAVGAEVVRLMKPFGVAAALGAIEQRTSEAAEKRRQVELALKQERFDTMPWILTIVSLRVNWNADGTTLSFEIIFDSRSGRSTTDANNSQIPIGRGGGDALPTRGFLPWRFSNAGSVSADSNGQ